ncbi:hypothetical protein KQH82_03310 [bacterium]|nr:hypothetical protein [bacterium]
MRMSRRTRYTLGAATLALALLVVVIHYTGFCELQAVTLDGQAVGDFDGRLGLKASKSVVDQPLDSVAHALLTSDEIRKVDIHYSIPSGIEIVTNKFDPVCFVISERTGKLYGLDHRARVIAIPDRWDNWEHPILVNTRVEEMFEPCRDVRVPMVLADLQRLADEHADLYRVVTEIDFSQADYLVITLSGLEGKLWVTAGGLYDQLERLVRFLYNFSPSLDSARIIDLRFENQIVCSVKGR